MAKAGEAPEGNDEDEQCCRSPSTDAASCCDVQPVLLEVNYSPDLGKMLEMHPDFVNDAFAQLFLEDERDGSTVECGARPHADGVFESKSELWDELPIMALA